MKKMYLVCVVILMMAMGMTASAAETGRGTASADDWTAEAKNGVVTVRNDKGNEIARLEYEKEPEAEDFLLAADYNFDGRSDLAALMNMGTANSYYTVWLRTEDGTFEAVPEFEEICAPRANAAMERIESSERISAAEYRESRYVWEEDALLLQRVREIVYQEDGTVEVTERFSDGEVSAARLYRAEYEKWDCIVRNEMQAEAMLAAAGVYERGMTASYAGMAEVDGEVYFVYSCSKESEMICAVYVHETDSSVMLMDDVMDGEQNPRWIVTAEGIKTERD